MKIVFDTSAVIYLMEKWELLDELLDFAQSNELLVPERVREEFVNGDIHEGDRENLKRVFTPVPVALEQQLLPYFNFDSSDGAIWAISLTIQTPGSLCIIDEQFGRNVCSLLGVNHTGCVGIIRRMVVEGIIPQSRIGELKTRIRKSSFYQKEDLLDGLDK